MRQTQRKNELTTNNSLDIIDHKILNILQEDCRLSFNKVASKADISVGTAYNRIKSLEAQGTVRGYTVNIDSVKLGYSLTAVILVQGEGKGGSLTAVEKEIAKYPNTIAVYDVTGDYDIAVIAKFRDRNHLNLFIKQLAAIPYVKRTVTNVSLNTVKEEFKITFPVTEKTQTPKEET
jgi:DNA-binding Lrp family transcriptional regulator